MHIHHLAIRVRNLDDSVRFYEELVGLRVAKRFHAGTGELAYMTNGEGETEIELIHIPDDQQFEGKGFFICFEPDEIEKTHEKAVKLGLMPSDIRHPDEQSSYFYVYDPNGVSVQFRQWI